MGDMAEYSCSLKSCLVDTMFTSNYPNGMEMRGGKMSLLEAQDRILQIKSTAAKVNVTWLSSTYVHVEAAYSKDLE